MKYSERHDKFQGKVIISYPLRWGGNRADARLWLAELNGEVWDYGTREYLIGDAVARGKEYVVLRVHRNGEATPLRS